MNGRRKISWMRAWLVVGACVALVMAGGAAVRGQTVESLPLARSYGSGVHAYFSGDFERSYDDLSATIEAGSDDPRTRYFRGLAALRLGRLDEAEADFSEGAELEARALGSWQVSRSLERVQGHDRLRLERHRARARVAALQRDRAAERERYSGIEDAQTDVLRRRRPVELPAPAQDAANPFVEQPVAPAVPEEPPAAPAPEMPATEEPAADADAPPPEMEMAPGAEAAPAEAPFGDGAPTEPEMPGEPLPPAEVVPGIEGQ